MSSATNPQSLTKSLWERLQAIADDTMFPIRLSVDETEEVIRILWEFVGLLGSKNFEIEGGGYENHLLDRARHWAQELQTAMLAAVAAAGTDLIAAINGGPETAEKKFGQFDSGEGGGIP